MCIPSRKTGLVVQVYRFLFSSVGDVFNPRCVFSFSSCLFAHRAFKDGRWEQSAALWGRWSDQLLLPENLSKLVSSDLVQTLIHFMASLHGGKKQNPRLGSRSSRGRFAQLNKDQETGLENCHVASSGSGSRRYLASADELWEEWKPARRKTSRLKPSWFSGLIFHVFIIIYCIFFIIWWPFVLLFLSLSTFLFVS